MPRPTRARKAHAPAIVENSSDAEMEVADTEFKPDAEPEPEPVAHRPKAKRAKRARADQPEAGASAAAPTKRRKAGRLAKLQEMPLDVLFEIFGFLHATDLLKLTRTNKTIRNLLMARSARPTWIQALREEPDLPECPEDMSEPAWAHLAFEMVCHNCGTSSVRNVFWALRRRVCNRCIDGDSSGLIISHMLEWDPKAGGVEYTLIPSDSPDRYHRFYLQKDHDDMKDAMKDLQHGSLEREEYIEKRKQITVAIKRHAERCSEWQAHYQSDRSDGREAARQRRKDAIKVKLREIGFADEVDWMHTVSALSSYGSLEYDFSNLKSVKQPKDLTPRIWKNIEKEVIPFMEKVRGYMEVHQWLELFKRRVELLVSRLETLEPAPAFIPRVIDLYDLDGFRDILERPLVDDNDDVTKESFDDALADIDAVLAHCRTKRTAQVLAVLRERDGADAADPTAADFALAANLFACSECVQVGYARDARVLTGAQVLVHRCRAQSSYMRFPGREHWVVRERSAQLALVCQRVPGAGGAGDAIVHTGARTRAHAVVELAGLDPATATLDEMDALGMWFACLCRECVRKMIPRARPVLDWRAAVNHRLLDIRRLDAEETTRAEEARENRVLELPAAGIAAHLEGWDCQHCSKMSVNAYTLRTHLREAHDIAAPVLDTDFAASEAFAEPWPALLIESDERPPYVSFSHFDSGYDEHDDDVGHYGGGLLFGLFASLGGFPPHYDDDSDF